jgi:hypothetical protein
MLLWLWLLLWLLLGCCCLLCCCMRRLATTHAAALVHDKCPTDHAVPQPWRRGRAFCAACYAEFRNDSRGAAAPEGVGVLLAMLLQETSRDDSCNYKRVGSRDTRQQ